MRILVTGSREFTDWRAVQSALDAWKLLWSEGELVVGDCPTGADALATDYAYFNGAPVKVYRADWSLHGPGAGPIRNKHMVESGADICLAFLKDPDDPKKNRGTRDCMRRARAAGIEVIEYVEA